MSSAVALSPVGAPGTCLAGVPVASSDHALLPVVFAARTRTVYAVEFVRLGMVYEVVVPSPVVYCRVLL